MSKLSDELTVDPKNVGYSSMSDQEVSDSLNAVDIEVDKPVPMRDILSYLFISGKFEGIYDDSNNTESLSRGVSLSFVFASNNTNFSELNFSNPAIMGMIDAMMSAGLINSDDKTAILSLGKILTSRASQLGLQKVRVGHVQEAR